MAQMNITQMETLEMLTSQIDNLETAEDETDDGVFVFSGDGVDGPSVGYIEIDGQVTWITGG